MTRHSKKEAPADILLQGGKSNGVSFRPGLDFLTHTQVTSRCGFRMAANKVQSMLNASFPLHLNPSRRSRVRPGYWVEKETP